MALWFAFVYVTGFSAGGYIAGRMRAIQPGETGERSFQDGAHGFLVWAVGTLLGAYMLSTSAGSVASKTVDAAAAVAGATGAAVAGRGISAADFANYAVDRMLRPGAPSATAPAAPRDPAVTQEFVRIMASAAAKGSLDPADKAYASNAIAARAGIPAPDASARVEEAFNSMQKAKADAEQKARDAAEVVRKTGILAAFLAAAVSFAGLVAATWAAGTGGHDREHTRPLQVFGRERFW